MAKKAENPGLEKKVIKAITTNGSEGQKLLSMLSAEHFASTVGREAYARIKTVLTNRSVLTEWESLVYDQVLSDHTRAALLAVEQDVYLDNERVNAAFTSMERYRKHRALIQLHNELGAELSKNDFDIEAVERELHDRVMRVHSQTGGVEIVTIGTNDNAAEYVERIINGLAVKYIPTGFATFDGRSVGIPDGSFMLIAATTGGGKSALAKRLGTNIAESGHRVAMVPLEMNNESVLQRVLSEQSQVTMTKFLDPVGRFTDEDYATVWSTGYEDLRTRIAARGGDFSLLAFEESVDVRNLLLRCKSLNYKIIIIDYLGLLEGAAADDQVKALDRIARYAKVWADKNKAVVIAAAQLSEEGIVRYAKAMKEHASTLWQWVYNENCRETKSILINQTKSRQQEAFDFHLHFDPATQTVRDMTEEEMAELQGTANTVENPARGGKAKKGPVRHFDDLNEQ